MGGKVYYSEVQIFVIFHIALALIFIYLLLQNIHTTNAIWS
jgi:hypothetical protein